MVIFHSKILVHQRVTYPSREENTKNQRSNKKYESSISQDVFLFIDILNPFDILFHDFIVLFMIVLNGQSCVSAFDKMPICLWSRCKTHQDKIQLILDFLYDQSTF